MFISMIVIFISIIVILVLELSIFGYKFSVLNEAQKVNGCVMTIESRRELHDFLFKKIKGTNITLKEAIQLKKLLKKIESNEF